MILDAVLPPSALDDVPQIVRSAEKLGFGALWTTETMHDPFLPGAIIAENSKKIKFGTAVAIAFARSPATMAYTAWDLAEFSKGRFILGLGTQIKPHIVRRFGMTWPDSVVGKLREQIQAIRAFWDTWQNGVPLSFRGEYYKLTLMSPFFNPGPINYPQIPIYIAGVNKRLASLAGEIADGFLVHPLHTQKYLQDVLIPAIKEGAESSHRKLEEICISVSAFVVTSPEEEFFVRSQIAFYASTPSYRPVMALHGWQEIGEQLSVLVRNGQWSEMPALITDEMLETFAIVSSVDSLPCRLLEKYQSLAGRLTLYLPYRPGEREHFWKHCLENTIDESK